MGTIRRGLLASGFRRDITDRICAGTASANPQTPPRFPPVGMDIGSAMDFTYKLPFKFTGTIEKVEIDLNPAN